MGIGPGVTVTQGNIGPWKGVSTTVLTVILIGVSIGAELVLKAQCSQKYDLPVLNCVNIYIYIYNSAKK